MRKRIGLLVGQPEEELQSVFLQGFLEKAAELDFDTCIFAMIEKHQFTKGKEIGDSYIYSLVEYNTFDAIVVLADSIQTPGLMSKIEEDLHNKCTKPVIFTEKESRYYPSILSDNVSATKKIISHLIEEHDCKDIAYLTGLEHHPHSIIRMNSFIECMEEHGLTVKDNRLFYGDFWYNSGESTVAALVKDKDNMPDAIACANDFMAIGVINELEKEGFRVPQDVAVVGFDACLEGRKNLKSVTSVMLPGRDLGVYCMEYLYSMMYDTQDPVFYPEPKLFIGKSCGCSVYNQSFDWKQVKKPEVVSLNYEKTLYALEDDFLLQREASGMVNIIFSYVQHLKPFDSFHLCLNEPWSHDRFEEDSASGFSDNILDAIICGDKVTDISSMDALFDRKTLLPELDEESEKPRVYYFSPLYFEDRCFGYSVIRYADHGDCYQGKYVRWLQTLGRGLEIYMREALMRQRINELEISQVRDDVTGLYNYRGFVKTVLETVDELGSYAYLNAAAIEILGASDNKILADFAQLLMANTQNILCYFGGSEFMISEIMGTESDKKLDDVVALVNEKFTEYCHNNGIDGKYKIAAGTYKSQITDQESIEDFIISAIGEKNVNRRKVMQDEATGITSDQKDKIKLVAKILDENLLYYHFQPIVNTGSGDIFAYEALMRARTEERISPLDILKFAQALNRLDDVEKATFFNVLTYIEEHAEMFKNKKVFINSIPGTVLSDEDAEEIKERLKNLSGKIVVELTEQSELTDEELEALKTKYKSIGVDTAVDDYGTGYSNVFNLLRYMPNVVKIDRMLLASIQLSPQKQHFVKDIIEFSHNNGITVLAEGIETTEELKMVTMLGADLIQGYYTAKPNEEVIQEIDSTVKSEMVQYGQYALDKGKRKVYQTGQDPNVNLVKLVTGHYSKIVFSCGKVSHRDINILGLQGFKADMEIEIQDSYSGRIELSDVDLSGNYDKPAIRLGENCDVTIALSGNNILEQGGILVPESSRLTFEGDGNLKILKVTADGYAIGSALNTKCGEITFDQDGCIEIHGNTVRGVGIGADLGGKISINRGSYNIQLAGEQAVAVGSLSGDVQMMVQYCHFVTELNNSLAVGIGSIDGSADISIQYAHVEGTFSARKGIGVGTVNGGKADCHFNDGILEINARSTDFSGVGSLSGDASLYTERFALKVTITGDNAVAIGNLNNTAVIETHDGDNTLHVRNKLPFDAGAKSFTIYEGYQEFIHNDNPVEREVIRM